MRQPSRRTILGSLFLFSAYCLAGVTKVFPFIEDETARSLEVVNGSRTEINHLKPPAPVTLNIAERDTAYPVFKDAQRHLPFAGQQ